jgi:hypothetical protein
MTNDHDPIQELLLSLVASPEPTNADRQYAERALSHAIAAATARRRWPRRAWAVAVAVVVGLAVAVTVVVQTTRPTAAQATLDQIARAAERADPLTVPDTGYAYAITEAVVLGEAPPDAFPIRNRPLAYLLPQVRETWIGTHGTVQLRTTTQPPIFFSPEDEADYYEAQLDVNDGVGTTITETVTGTTSVLDERQWPTQPHTLLEVIEGLLPSERGLPRQVEIAELALTLLRDPRTPPSLRSALLRIIGDLEVELLQQQPDETTTFGITYRAPLLTRQTFTLTTTGHLTSETTTLLESDTNLGIPTGTITYHATYIPPRIVPDINAPTG